MHTITNEHTRDQTAQPCSGLHDEDAATLRGYYYRMLLIRRFAEHAEELSTTASNGGVCHRNHGDEATTVGLLEALRPADYIFTNHREDGYSVARGVAPVQVMPTMSGASPDESDSQRKAIQLFDPASYSMDDYASVGADLSLAVVGAGWRVRRQLHRFLTSFTCTTTITRAGISSRWEHGRPHDAPRIRRSRDRFPGMRHTKGTG